jgi:uncharacterized protein (DUF3820 family)
MINISNKEFIMKEYYKEYAYTKMPWGKHKGKFLKDIPEDYLKWAVANWSDRGVAEMFKIELLRRVPALRRG